MPELPTSWQKLSALSAFLAAVLVPLAVALTGQKVSTALKEREMQGKFVELAVGILREPPKFTEVDSIRGWATGILSKYSGVAMTRGVQQALQSTTPLPERGFHGSTPDSVNVSVAPPRELLDALRRMRQYSGFQSDTATMADARRMLLAVGLDRISESPGAVSAMIGTWLVTLWPGSYGKARAFGIRYQPMPAGNWDAQSTYQEIIMPVRD